VQGQAMARRRVSRAGFRLRKKPSVDQDGPSGKDKTLACSNRDREKKPTNKKRPKLSRVMGRPNSPPPGLLTVKIRPIRRSVNSTFVPISWHQQAMSRVALPEPYPQRYRNRPRLARSSSWALNQPREPSLNEVFPILENGDLARSHELGAGRPRAPVRNGAGYSRNRPEGDCR
jgi:hypothetical protein